MTAVQFASLSLVLAALVACKKDEKAAAGPSSEASPEPSAATPPTTPTLAAPGTNVCQLISAETVKNATGISGEGTSSKSGDADVCTWMGADSSSAVVQIYRSSASYEASRRAFEGLYKTKAEELPGVGNKAFYLGGNTASIPTATISVDKGGRVASVQVMAVGGDADKLKANAVALTKAVVGAL